jgi:polysaccharide deacetylase 2 family uncharacterized protein YibQ
LLKNLPPAITVAYSPYARPEQNSEQLRLLGHEVWTMLPTMDARFPASDPGPVGLIPRLPPEETIRRTQQTLAAVVGSVGLILAPEETILLQKDAFAPALGEISKRGLLLLSTHPSRNIDQITTNAGLAESIRRADLILDPEPNESAIRSKLAGVITAAKEKGEYVVMLSARPQSLELLATWLKETPLDASVRLAPLSSIYQPKEVQKAAPPAEEGHKEKPKPKPAVKKQKPLPQDQYKQAPAEGEESGGHH